MVEMQKWGVTKDDLHQFRRLVMNAILEQRILPTERDPFDPNDFTKGPSMYTVNEQYIKPVTHQAGDASWSLMKHPEGMEVNLFITHGWAEGIFEFVDKVISSWPSRATAAYVCFLSPEFVRNCLNPTAPSTFQESGTGVGLEMFRGSKTLRRHDWSSREL